MSSSSRGLLGAALAMLILGAVYEPLRLVAGHFGWMQVGGVGGVGGLVNLGDPGACSSMAAHEEAYCYIPGVVFGFMPFGLLVLFLWTSPLLIGALKVAFCRPAMGTICVEPMSASPAAVCAKFYLAWLALSCLWFVVPFVYFLSDPFFQTCNGVVLAVSLSASYPLSWHLALVAVPVSDLVASHLGMPEAAVKSIHKALGWRTAGLAVTHGLGQLLWMTKDGFAELNIAKIGENMIYVLGIVTLVLLALHTAVAIARRQVWLRAHFKAIHRSMALLALVSATAHWWPFAILLVPCAAAHGGLLAARAARAGRGQVLLHVEARALAAACVGAVLGLAAVWTARDWAMRQPGVDTRSPFVFPPLALLAEGFGAWAAAAVSIRTARVGEAEEMRAGLASNGC